MPEFDPNHTTWDPDCGLTYAEWLQEKNTRPLRHGESISVRDERGHVITRHADGRQDVQINL